MIAVSDFYQSLLDNQIDFFSGVPDSLLKDICAYITDHTEPQNNIIAANEGGAIALAAGYHLATGKIPMVYMQNSGLGNAINPLTSLADKEVYAIPMLLMIGWRGEPGTHDEPQHIKQGRITIGMLESMEIPFFILDRNTDYKQTIANAAAESRNTSMPVALLVRKNAFENYKLESIVPDAYNLTREKALEIVLNQLPTDAILVSTTGMLSRELFEMREKYRQSHNQDFLTVGSMGHASQIALGIALAKPDKLVICLDGDGAALMHLGNYGVIGDLAPPNLKLILFNNGAHDSVGGQPTLGHHINFSDLANLFNLKSFGAVQSEEEIIEGLQQMMSISVPAFIDIRIKKGARADLGRPTTGPQENKIHFMGFLNR
jgi:phosphonopyruvate decarboxylase